MATTLYLRDDPADTHLATNTPSQYLGTTGGWVSKALATSRGSGVVASDNVPTVSYLFAATEGNEVTKGSTRVEWLSPPVAADVTISGSITGNVWASESNMSANVAVLLSVEIIRANALASSDSNTRVYIDNRIGSGSEVDVTTRAVRNGTLDTTNVTVNRGDRIRVLIVSKGAGSQVSGYTWNASWNGTSAAADGDSYVSFTENFSFESAPVGPMEITDLAAAINLGIAGVGDQSAQSFVGGATLTYASAYLLKTGSPSGNVVAEVRTDSAGSPSSTVVAVVATVATSSLTTSAVKFEWSGLSISLTPGATYWLLFRGDTAWDASNRASIYRGTGSLGGLYGRKDYAGGWSGLQANALTVRVEFGASAVYLTDTASAVSTASVDREAWTSRGSGFLTDERTSVTGWTAPLQLTDTTGGTVVDWFTKPLTAFTLGGMAVANIWCTSGQVISMRCEIARVAGDGTSPTVWGSWCIAPTGTDNGDISASDVARTAYVSGDDLAITDGQRLRIRIYADDPSNAAMNSGGALTVRYNEDTPGGMGDTYVTFPQTLTEYSAPAAGGPAPLRQRRASRFLTFR